MDTNDHDLKIVKLDCSITAFVKIKMRGTAKSPKRENNVSAEISCFTVYMYVCVSESLCSLIL